MTKDNNPLKEFFYNKHHKTSLKWNHYFDIYHRHFKRFINTDCVILEIGVHKGGSLQMWKNYFGSKAKIYGIDLDPSVKKNEEDNIQVIIGDQADKTFLKELKSTIPQIDILIDDGGHQMEQQINTFEVLFDHIKENGIYLCEDTHTSYWKEYGGGLNNPDSFIEYSKKIIDNLNAWHLRDSELVLSELTRNVNSLHYYDSVFVVEKSLRQRPSIDFKGHEIDSDDSQYISLNDINLLKLRLLGIEETVISEIKKSGFNEIIISKMLGDKYDGKIWPDEGETMIGYKRLQNLEYCIYQTIDKNIEGDLLEAGVWRGGACIFMRAMLFKYGVFHKKIWVADSFEGLPEPDSKKYPQDKESKLHEASELKISLDEVKNNFEKYGLYNGQVKFLKGWFKDTFPKVPINKLSVLRLDGDMYESTIDTLFYLYPKLSIGGFCIVDDLGAVPACKSAVDDYREVFGIIEPIEEVDWAGIFWRKEHDVSKISKKKFNRILRKKGSIWSSVT